MSGGPLDVGGGARAHGAGREANLRESGAFVRVFSLSDADPMDIGRPGAGS